MAAVLGKILFILIIPVLLLAFPIKSFAQTHTATPSATMRSTPYATTQSFSPQSPHTASIAIYNFSHAISCILVGRSPISPCLEYKMSQDAQGMIMSVPVLGNANTSNGILGLSLSMIGEVIGSPPIRSSEFIADMGQQLGIREANAQVGGSGSGVLSPIFKLWEVSRNISYVAMIIIFLLVGLMVMFRQKLNPQTVVSIQMALPGLVIGLVMITFSYFLASLISDIAFLGTNVVGYYFSLAQPPGQDPTQLPLNAKTGYRKGLEENALTIFSRYSGVLNTGNIRDALFSVWGDLEDPTKHISKTGSANDIISLDPQKALTYLAAMITVQFLLPIGNLGGGFTQFVLGGTGALVALNDPVDVISWSLGFIAMIAMIYSMLRLLLKLINNFLSIIFLTIAAPFYFLAASLPGRQGLVTNWLFNMLCNVLAFPAVFAIFYFVAFMLAGPDKTADPLFALNYTTALANKATFPLLGGLKLDFLNALVAFGALLAAPSVPDLICRAVGKPGQLGGIAAGAIGAGIAAGQRYSGQVSSGAHGFSQAVGRLPGDAGLIRDPISGNWRRPENMAEGARVGSPGQAARMYNSWLWRKAGLPRPSTPTPSEDGEPPPPGRPPGGNPRGA